MLAAHHQNAQPANPLAGRTKGGWEDAKPRNTRDAHAARRDKNLKKTNDGRVPLRVGRAATQREKTTAARNQLNERP